MGNIFTDLVAKLTRRQKKNKPVPVPYKKPIRRQPEPPETPMTVVTYNRVDGVVSGGTLNPGTFRMNESQPPVQQKPKGAYWDDEAKIYKGTNYVIQAQEAERRERQRRIREDDDDFLLFTSATTFDDSFFYQNQETSPETTYTASDSASGYDYPRETFSPVYEAPSPSYGASESTTTYSGGSSGYSSGYSDSSSSYSGSSSSYSSDSGSSYSSSDSGGGSYGGE